MKLLSLFRPLIEATTTFLDAPSTATRIEIINLTAEMTPEVIERVVIAHMAKGLTTLLNFRRTITSSRSGMISVMNRGRSESLVLRCLIEKKMSFAPRASVSIARRPGTKRATVPKIIGSRCPKPEVPLG
jgi:hypothetical protein